MISVLKQRSQVYTITDSEETILLSSGYYESVSVSTDIETQTIINEMLANATVDVEDVNIDHYNRATSGIIEWVPTKDCFFYGNTYTGAEYGSYPNHSYSYNGHKLAMISEDGSETEVLSWVENHGGVCNQNFFVFVPNGSKLVLTYSLSSATRFEACLKGTVIYINYD